ncbi:hypothetical protein E2C01_088996 [Portunus trituberculatus]|uniref:Uncharacterized protein n=1 Tax=Portunus trituberculatus TaxID=210409 RepID=A0A5B7J7N8_PORTR|nr:hypothetical protein [Portunus trituberculatus]
MVALVMAVAVVEEEEEEEVEQEEDEGLQTFFYIFMYCHGVHASNTAAAHRCEYSHAKDNFFK